MLEGRRADYCYRSYYASYLETPSFRDLHSIPIFHILISRNNADLGKGVPKRHVFHGAWELLFFHDLHCDEAPLRLDTRLDPRRKHGATFTAGMSFLLVRVMPSPSPSYLFQTVTRILESNY